MQTYYPGQSYYAEFVTSRFSTGAAYDATGTPVATATKNGVDDAGFVLTVTNLATGRYKITGTVPSTYSVGDAVQISVAATVDSVAGKGVVDSFAVGFPVVGNVVRTSQLPGINNNLTTDDSAVINAAIVELYQAGGGTLIWDGTHAMKAPLVCYSGVTIRGVDLKPRFRYFGAAEGGVDDHCIRNANEAIAWSTRAGTIVCNGESVTMPVALASGIDGDDTAATVGAFQALLVSSQPVPALIRISRGPRFEDVSVTNVDTDTNILTIVRAQNGTEAQSWAAGSTLQPVVRDTNITIENLCVDGNAQSYTNVHENTRLAALGLLEWCFGIGMTGAKNLTIKNVHLYDSPSFGFTIRNVERFHLRGCYAVGHYNYGLALLSDDCYHFNGPWKYGLVEDCVGLSGDNCCGVNWSEGEGSEATFGQFGPPGGDCGILEFRRCEFSTVYDSSQSTPLSVFGSANTRLDRLTFDSCRIASPVANVIHDYGDTFTAPSEIGTVEFLNCVFDGSAAGAVQVQFDDTFLNNAIRFVDCAVTGAPSDVAALLTNNGILKQVDFDGVVCGSKTLLNNTGSTVALLARTRCHAGNTLAAGSTAPTTLLDDQADETTLDAIAADVLNIDGAAIPIDYQQRAVAVTLPTTPPDGYGGQTGDVTLAATQPNYAPAKAADIAANNATLAAAVWAALTSGLTTAGSVGKWLYDTIGLVKTKTDTITAGSVTTTSPVNANQDVEITQHDDYLNANSRALAWSNSSGTWFAGDITGATITITVTTMDGTAVLTKAGAVVTPTGNQAVSVELTAANTALFTKAGKQYQYQLLLKKTGYREMEVAGDIIVTLSLSPPA